MGPAGIFLVGFALYATIYLIYLSLCNWNVMNPSPVLTGFSNYVELMKDHQFWSSVEKTAIFVSAAVGAEIILGFLIALILNRKIVGLGVIRALLILPMAMTPAVVGLIWRILYDPTLGLINYLLSLVGIQGPAWVAKANTALFSLIVVDIWQWTPFAILVITAGLKALPIEPYEAAKIDGASALQTVRYITIPLLKQVLLVLILLRGIDALKTFDIIFVITNGGPGTATQTIVFYTFLRGFHWFSLGYASAISVVLMIVVTIGVKFFIRYTGVKIADVS
jgi:multiple sugar transport system permease protein